jgi:hypothetical protein
VGDGATGADLGRALVAEGRSLRTDAHLEPFADLAPHAKLVETVDLACQVAKIARTLTWHRAISAQGPDAVGQRWVDGPITSIASLVDDACLGRA